ncbi:hypothetical protein VOLCADRAFT_99746 [Volvox carteri f. nagariensis]|uniref:Uncharacterized protein n=1 Tax=Volvox carteri f. nagariensis TaxID=3068 RepID=D8UIJ6_VOLCA|nr:uncharacterized protein VOLCADRAFT_99746 [Volvox carteri f. nagariensis]EFJ40465.1 hypothetical protein VOLCADRAFT_99746 [Volvox carteri f. nagariensis]|eukprot:XP_002958465.1 hypothetical protein VOLCADRAFT_99746 [Volvox carteri f. nagariensis]
MTADALLPRGKGRGYAKTVQGHLIRRYKRFLADVVLPAGDSAKGRGSNSGGSGDMAAAATALEASGASSGVVGNANNDPRGGVTITCHCPNTGPMTGLLDWPLSPVVCSVSSAPGRKYPHTVEMLQVPGPAHQGGRQGPRRGGAWVGVHSALANQLVSELLDRRLLPQLGEWRDVAREVPYGSRGSRYAAAAWPNNPVVNSTASASATGAPELLPPPPRIALFPDTVSERAQRHVEDLMEAVSRGHEAPSWSWGQQLRQAVCVFVIQRDDCALFAPCAAKDPVYARLVRQLANNEMVYRAVQPVYALAVVQAAAAGVQMLALRTSVRPPTTAAAAVNVTTHGDVEGTTAPAAIVFLGLAELDLEYGSSTDRSGVGGGVLVAAKTKRGRRPRGQDGRSDKTDVKRRSKPKQAGTALAGNVVMAEGGFEPLALAGGEGPAREGILPTSEWNADGVLGDGQGRRRGRAGSR